MNLLQLISKNNLLKFSLVLITIFFISLNAQSEIPEKYKIESSLKKCKGTDYRKWNNCYSQYKFPRIEYKGEWKNGNFHGKGVLKEAWGGIYFGDFKNNLADGYGRQEEVDGTWWEGEVKDDRLNGQAQYYSSRSKCLSKGNFVDFDLNGKGEIICESGYKALGNFKNDELDGQGIEIYSNGTKKEGQFIDGYLNGKGEIHWKSGSYESGNFVNGELDGKGIYITKNGNKYVGDFKNGNFHGQGTYTWADGEKYIGGFEDDIRSGFGTFYYISGNIYEGNFANGDQNGFGKYTWVDGDKYEGDYLDGLRTGKGKYTYASGSVYEGDFLNNLATGYGTFLYSTGEKYVGELLDGYENGFGKYESAEGDIYEGNFKDGTFHGQGKMVYANGTIYEGLWEDGKEAEGKTTLAKFTTDEKYYALIIGNNNYEKLEDLDNAVNDAKDLEKVLKEKYGFETTLLIDEKSDETENAIIKFTQNREKNDNILIYYAGHGELVKKQKRGYWLPTDAGPSQDSKWLSNNNIKDLISSSDAKHVLLVVDSCFSGSLMRGSGDQKSVEKLTSKRIERLQAKKTRIVITSGGNEQVVDGIGASTNSVFAKPLIKYLKENTDVIQSIELFQKVQSYVIDNADQTPNHSTIHGTGHDGGEFLFFPIS